MTGEISSVLPWGLSSVAKRITDELISIKPFVRENLEVMANIKLCKNLKGKTLFERVFDGKTGIAQLIEIDGKRLVFKVEAFDEVEKIGEGTHQRYIIELDKFKSRAQGKSII